MKQSGNDNYDLNTSSPQGHAGFEPFRTEKHFYFHFNDEAGDSILFSQAYKTKKGRDNGMVSIRKNIKNKAHLIFHHDDDLHYFSIKAGNNQEVTRSRNFESKEEMEASIQYLYQKLGEDYQIAPKRENSQQIIIELKEDLTEKETIETELREKIWELETALAETSNSLNDSLLQKEIWIKEKTSLEERMVILAKRSSDLAGSKTTLSESENTIEEIPTTNFSFRINFYNVDNTEDVKMVIYHPMTKDKKILQGFDKEAMIDYMVSKLPSTILPLIKEDIEKELDATKITKTVFVARNAPSPIVSTIQDNTNNPSIKEEKIVEKSQLKNIESNFQMKALIEAAKSSNMSITKPTFATKESQIENTAEELAIINKFFSQEVKGAPKSGGTVQRETVPNINNLDNVAINSAQIENTAEELAIIKQFFSQEVKVAPVSKVTLKEEIEASINDLETSEITTPEEEKIIQQFFPRVQENLRENLGLADTSSTYLDDFIAKNKEKKSTPTVEVIDITLNPKLAIDEAAEIALIEQFFPANKKSKTEEEIAVQIDIDKVLNEISKDSEKKSTEEVAIINKFFKAEVKREKVELPKPLNLNLSPVETVLENNQEEQANIAKFFGFKKESKAKNNQKVSQDDLIATILSNVAKKAIDEPNDQEIINKFFGKEFQKTVVKNKVTQSLPVNAKEEDIKLYNKFFGKNIAVNRSNSCRI